MPSLYASQFDVVPGDSNTGALFDELERRVQAWVVDGYQRKWGIECTYPGPGESSRPLPDHFLYHRLDRVGDETSLSALRWKHPDQRDAYLSWGTEIRIARLRDRVQFALQLGLTSTSFVVRPTNLALGRPRIVTDVLSSFSCWAATQPIVAQKQQVAAGDIPSFVETQLLDPKRLLPFVVVSCDRFSDRPVVDADRLQKSLLGFAQVVLMDKWASFALTDSVGKALSCFNGCVRVYWPGLTRASDPWQHWLYFPAQLERFEYLKKPLSDRLFAYLAQLSVFRFVDGDVLRDVQTRLDGERQKAAQRHRQQFEEGRAAAKSLKEMQDLLDWADQETKDLRQRLTDREKEVEELQDRLKDVQANFGLMQQQYALAAESRAQDVEADVEFETVADALAAIEHGVGSEAAVLDTARTSAAESDFPRPTEAYRALMAVCDIGRLYLQAPEAFGGWAEQFRERGFTQYSPTESDTVKNDYKNYGRHREFVVNGQKRRIYRHLDIGGGDKKACLQIYFEADRQLQAVIIAHCGRHLPIPKDRS